MSRRPTSISLLFLLLVTLTSCEDSDDGNPIIKDVSIYELNKEITRTNVTNTATGLRTVFNTMVLDSLNQAHLSQAFVNDARYFDDNSGYFFIETLNEAWVVAHINQDLIGTSRYDAQDINGKYHVREMINTVENIGYGFVNYSFINPASNQEEEKLSFVTGIPVVSWFVGSGFYLSFNDQYFERNEANELLIKHSTQPFAKGISGVLSNFYLDESDRVEFCRNLIEHIRFFDDQSGYFFIIDFNGLVIAHGTQEELEGQYLWDLQDSQGNYIIRGMSEIAQNNPEGEYFQYYWINPATGEDESKNSFVMQIPGTYYFIGAGVYQE